jgi:hypothetical protein
MKPRIVILAAALAITSTSALAGGHDDVSYANAPQFAFSNAANFAFQHAKSFVSAKGDIEQVTGASAESLNETKCACKGKQVAVANAKNVSVQSATLGSFTGAGTISQSSVATAVASNHRK